TKMSSASCPASAAASSRATGATFSPSFTQGMTIESPMGTVLLGSGVGKGPGANGPGASGAALYSASHAGAKSCIEGTGGRFCPFRTFMNAFADWLLSHIRQHAQRPALTLAGLCLLLWLPGIFSLPPMDRDESRFASASRQMLESGNFVDIRFGHEVRYK